MSFSKAQWRCLECIKSGFVVHKGERILNLNFTTAKDMSKSLKVSFAEFKKRVFRVTPSKLIDGGYVDGNRLNDFYPDTALNECLSFSYICIETSEGVSGVLHILYVGDFLPYRWLSDVWEEITGSAKVVDISEVKDKDRIAKYVSFQAKIVGYVASQSRYVKYSCSQDWVYKRWRSDFVRLKSLMFNTYVDGFRTVDRDKGSLDELRADVLNAFRLVREMFWKHWLIWLSSARFEFSSVDEYFEVSVLNVGNVLS